MKITRKGAIIGIASSVTAISLGWIIYLVVWSHTQDWNMQKAERHIPRIQPAIAADPRFEHVELAPFTGNNGSLLVHGFVTTEKAASDLQHLITQSRPPVFVRFEVIVMPDEPAAK